MPSGLCMACAKRTTHVHVSIGQAGGYGRGMGPVVMHADQGFLPESLELFRSVIVEAMITRERALKHRKDWGLYRS